MLTEKDYCDYETCVALREVGCRIETEWYIHQPSYERGSCYLCFGIPRETAVLDECDYIPRLSLYEAQKWLREEKHLHIEVRWYCNMWYEYEVKEAEGKVIAEGSAFPTYEEALRTAVYMATEHLKEMEE